MNAQNTPVEVGNVSDLRTDLAPFELTAAEVAIAVKGILALPKVTDAVSRKVMYDSLAAANSMKKVIDALRLKGTEKLRDRVAAINAYAEDKLKTPLEQAIAQRKPEIIAFDAEEKRKRDEEAERLRKEQEEIAAKGKQEVKAAEGSAQEQKDRLLKIALEQTKARTVGLTGIAKKKVEREIMEDLRKALAEVDKRASETITKTEIDTSVAAASVQGKAEDLEAAKATGARKEWDFEVVDINAVPVQYLKREVKRAEVLAFLRDPRFSADVAIPGLRIFQKDSLTLR